MVSANVQMQSAKSQTPMANLQTPFLGRKVRQNGLKPVILPRNHGFPHCFSLQEAESWKKQRVWGVVQKHRLSGISRFLVLGLLRPNLSLAENWEATVPA
jgi:hypothetical protein